MLESKLTYLNNTSSYGLEMTDYHFNQLIEHCVKKYPLETGGILIGHYSPDQKTAIVTEIIGPTQDSLHQKSNFFRGVKRLKGIINEKWRKGEYYIGEWHCHPGGNSVPSSIDNQQMAVIAHDKKIKCPEPILVIISGKPESGWQIKPYVYPDGINEEMLKRE